VIEISSVSSIVKAIQWLLGGAAFVGMLVGFWIFCFEHQVAMISVNINFTL